MSGRLISPATAIAPTSVASSAMPVHTSQVAAASGAALAGSERIQYESRPIEKPTHNPGWPLTALATTVSGPSTARNCSATRVVKRSTA